MGRVYRELPSATELWDRFDYKPLTGELVRRATGKIYTPNANGRILLQCGKSTALAHRIVFKWLYGADAKLDIDHVDGNPANNRAWNLREATAYQNMSNRRTAKGYSKTPSGKYYVTVTANNVKHHFGTYATEAEARAAYEKASRGLHGEFSGVG